MFVLIFSCLMTKEVKIVEASDLRSIEEYDTYVKNNLEVLAEDQNFSKVETMLGEEMDLTIYTCELDPVILQTRAGDSNAVTNAKTVLFRVDGGSKEEHATDKRNVYMGSVTLYYTTPAYQHACLTRITGYIKCVGDSAGIIITNQKVAYGLYGFNQDGYWENHRGDIPLSSQAASFSKYTGYTEAVSLYGEHNVGATYTITLRQPIYGDEWSFQIMNSL